MSVGSGAILRAIQKRWTAMKLDSIITGGLHLGTSFKGHDVPYCVLNIAAETISERTSSGGLVFTEYSRMMLDFVVHADTGYAGVERYADAIRVRFDNAPMMLQTGEGTVLRFRWVSGMPLQNHDNTSVWSYTLTYDVIRQRQEVVN